MPRANIADFGMDDLNLQAFEQRQRDRGIDLGAVRTLLKDLRIETASWGYTDVGGHFKGSGRTGVARNIFEVIEDAAMVHRLTGLCPRVALRLPSDRVDDIGALKRHAEGLDMRIGSINPNLIDDDAYMFGSVCNSDGHTRQKAINHLIECVQVAKRTSSEIVSIWLPDGIKYPGQADIRQRKHWLEEALQEAYRALDPNMRMLIEYKAGSAYYHTDLADWGMAYTLAVKLGPQAQVLVDTGHHAPGTNIEYIVAFLIDEEKLGGFHLNARKSFGGDLIVGSLNSLEIFLNFQQVLAARRDEQSPGAQRTAQRIACIIDQRLSIEPKIPAMIRSVLNVQTEYAKALLINWDELAAAQAARDVLRAEAAVREAFEQDPFPLLRSIREELGLPPDPMSAYFATDYPSKIRERGAGPAPSH